MENLERELENLRQELAQVKEQLRSAEERLQSLDLRDSQIRALPAEETPIKPQEEQLTLALELTKTGIWDWHLTTGIIYWNSCQYTLLGYEPGEIRPNYQGWRSRVHPDDINEVEQNLWQALENHTHYLAEFRVVYPDGTIHWLLGKGQGLYDETGQAVRMIGTVIDITQRKQVEIALMEIQDTLRIAVDAAEMGTWYLDLINDVSSVRSLRHDQIFGYETAQIEWGEAIARRQVIEADQKIWDEAFARAMRTGELNFEVRIRWADGSLHWMAARGRFYFDEKGTPIYGAGVNLDITQRKQTEIILREEQQKLNLFIRYAPVSVAMFDRTMCYLAVSQRWVETYQLGSSEAIIGRSHYQVFPNISQRWRQFHQEGLAGIANKCEQDHFILPDGSSQWLNWEIQPWFLDTGEVGGILIFVEDITSRKQVEIALQEQLTKEKLVSNIAQNIRQTLDLEQVLQRTVDQVRELLKADRVVIFRFQSSGSGTVMTESLALGWTSMLSETFYDECCAEHYFTYSQADFYARINLNDGDIKPCYRELLAPFQVQASLTVPLTQGQRLWGFLIVHQCSTPKHWQDTEIDLMKQLGTQVSIAIQQSELYQQTCQELLERQRAEQKITEQAALLNIATDAIFVQDLENHILFWNQGSERLYGWTEAEVLGQKSEVLFNKNQGLKLTEALQTTIEQGQWEGELEQVTKTGQKIIVESHRTLVENKFSQGQSILVVNSNITEKKELEKQFYHAQRLESLGTLASGISHDFNNILTPILGVSQLLPLMLPNLNEQTQNLLTILENSARRGCDLVKQILLFSRSTEGDPVALQVGYLLLELIGIAKQTFPKSIKIISEIPTRELWTISADSTQIHQVFMNLLVNARDAMPEGGNLSISAENRQLDQHYALMNLEAKAGPYVVVTVVDTGMGIMPDLLERIFDPFFTTKEVGKGTGLGLSTVRGIVKNHGGFIKVYSELGKGTKFEVFFPASAGETHLSLSEEVLPKGEGQLILIVDDEPSIQEITKVALETHNYRTLIAGDGEECLTIYAQNQREISVILMDMMMPNLDGIKAIRTLKQINPLIKIIATSGLMTNQQQASEVEINTFLLKPYTTRQLLQALREVMGGSSLETVTQTPSETLFSNVEVLKQALGMMSPEWLGEMYQAAYSLDADVMLELIGQVPDSEIKLVHTLRDLVNNFQTDLIMDLTHSLIRMDRI